MNYMLTNNVSQMTEGAKGGANNNSAAGAADVNTDQKASIKIAPIKILPGVIPRLDDPISDPNGEKGDGGDEETAQNSEEGQSDDGEEGENEQEAPEPVKEVTFDGKKFKSAEDAIKFADQQLKIARNAQAKADRSLAPILKRLEQLEGKSKTANDNPANLPDTSNKNSGLDPETQEFWRQAHQGLLEINTLTDPAERAKQQLVFTAAIAQKLVEDARTSLLEELGQRIKPFEEQTAEAQNLNVAENAFRTLMAEKNDDGTSLYPELERESDLEAIISAWRNYEKVGIPKAILYHPDHIRMIVLAFRAANGGIAKPGPVLPPKPAHLNQSKPKPSSVTAGGFTPPNLTTNRYPSGMTIPGVFGKV